jgi:hypothetical protein
MEHGKNGLLVEEGDVAGLAMQIVETARDHSRVRKMGKALRKTVEQNYTMEKSIRGLRSILREARDHGKAGRSYPQQMGRTALAAQARKSHAIQFVFAVALHLSREDPKTAQELALKTIALDRGRGGGYLLLAQVSEKLGDWETARLVAYELSRVPGQADKGNALVRRYADKSMPSPLLAEYQQVVQDCEPSMPGSYRHFLPDYSVARIVLPFVADALNESSSGKMREIFGVLQDHCIYFEGTLLLMKKPSEEAHRVLLEIFQTFGGKLAVVINPDGARIRSCLDRSNCLLLLGKAGASLAEQAALKGLAVMDESKPFGQSGDSGKEIGERLKKLAQNYGKLEALGKRCRKGVMDSIQEQQEKKAN